MSGWAELRRIDCKAPTVGRGAGGLVRLFLCALVVVLLSGLAFSGPAFAAFARPFVRQLTGTPAGAFVRAGGIAVDGADNLWVADLGERTLPYKLDQFSSLGTFSQALSIEGNEGKFTLPESLAIDKSSGAFYVGGGNQIDTISKEGATEAPVEVFGETGAFSFKFGEFVESSVAVDNTALPSAGTVYVTEDGSERAIKKSTAAGAPESFGESGKQSYVSANRITGFPGESFGTEIHHAPRLLALDGQGDIFTVDENYNTVMAKKTEPAVLAYTSSGLFIRAFTGEETPGIDGNRAGGGFGNSGGGLRALAVDTVSDHLLVAVDGENQQAQRAAVIDEFDVAMGKFVGQITETSAGMPLHEITALETDSNGDLYAVDVSVSGKEGEEKRVAVVDTWGPGAFLPGVSVEEVGARTRTTALVSGSFDPEGQPPSECWFEYVSQTAYEATGFASLASGGKDACEPIPADTTAHPVKAKLTGLASGTTYRYRLTASTSGVLGGISSSEAKAFTAPHAPRIDSTSVENVSSVYADLRAQIDPLGAATSYWFEYGPTSTYGNTIPVLTSTGPDGTGIGPGGPTGSAEARVVQHIGGLQPGKEYHYRVVAVNVIEGQREVTNGPDQTFTTLPASSETLPDGRAYELVTPPNKSSAEDMFTELPGKRIDEWENGDVGIPSDSGEEFLLETRSAFGDQGHSFTGSGENTSVLRRSASQGRWLTIPLASPALGVQSVNPDVFNPSSFANVGIQDLTGSTASGSGATLRGLIGPAGGPYTQVHAEPEIVGGSKIPAPLVGASGDLSRAFLISADPALRPEGQDVGSQALFEWSGGALTLASVDEEGNPFRCGAWVGSYNRGGATHNAVSADGSKVFFTAPDPFASAAVHNGPGGPGCWNGATGNAPQLYVRTGGETVQVSAPQEGVVDPDGRRPAVYVGASEDGSRVFFLTETELTAEAKALALHDPELYEYNTQTGTLTRISAGEEGSLARTPGSRSGAHVYWIPAISPDGTVVYFTARGALTAGAPFRETVNNDGGAEQPLNLYRYEARTGKTTYVAQVFRYDYPENEKTGAWWTFEPARQIREQPSHAPNANWYATPDGRYLLFTSMATLTQFNTAKASNGHCYEYGVEGYTAEGLEFCRELYRYDAAAAERGETSIVCVSCDPSGSAPVSDAFFASTDDVGARSVGALRAMTDNGACVFFDSADRLVKQADNGTLNVYEWEAPGSGGCQTSPAAGVPVCEQASGCLSLISSGSDTYPSFFLGTSTDGRNVFFGTHAKLVSQDTDNSGDIYDARIDGGFPTPAGIGPCEGDACSSPPLSPIDATPGSLTFAGAGNAPVASGAKSSTSKRRVVTRSRRLARALAACREKHHRGRRARCEALARRRYRPMGKRSGASSRRAANRRTGRTGR